MTRVRMIFFSMPSGRDGVATIFCNATALNNYRLIPDGWEKYAQRPCSCLCENGGRIDTLLCWVMGEGNALRLLY
jgi:hypothetical protein